MSRIVFDRHSSRPCRAVFLKGSEVPGPKATVSEFLSLPGNVSELLLRHDGVCFSIYGENCLIPVLLKHFGSDGTLELLTQGAVRFHLQHEMVTYAQSELPGVLPLQSGKHNSAIHSDPEASVDSILQSFTHPLPGGILPSLRRALVSAYEAPKKDYAPTAVALGHDAYSHGRFAKLGLPTENEVAFLPRDQRALLCHLATELHDLAIIADLQMETLDEFAITVASATHSLRNWARARKWQPLRLPYARLKTSHRSRNYSPQAFFTRLTRLA